MQKNAFRKLLILISVFTLGSVQADCNSCASSCSTSAVTTCFVPRSHGRNKVIQVVGAADITHLYDNDCWYAAFAIAPEYSQAFRQKDICHCLFGPVLTSNVVTGTSTTFTTSCPSRCKDNDCIIRIQGCGTAADQRVNNALAADNFYLPSDFDSEVRFSPRIRSFLLNFDLYVGLGDWGCLSGLYARFYGPFEHTRWNLRMCEKINNAGTINPSYDFGVFTPGSLAPSDLLGSFSQYIVGCNAPAPTRGTISGGPEEFEFTIPCPPFVTFQPLQAGRISRCEITKNGFADLRAEFGWNFFNCEDYHLGLNFQVSAPTSCRRNCADFLFAPHIGSGHWEVGGGLTGHYTFWRSECEDFNIGFYLDANITHLLSRCEERVFDLKNKPLSRYLLASKFIPTNSMIANANLIGTTGSANFQFAHEFAPVANITRQNVKVSAAVQADLVAWFNVSWCNFGLDVGYNFWARSCEKIRCNAKCNKRCPTGLDGRTWGLKGTARMFGFASSDDEGFESFESVGLSATQSLVTINGCITNPNTNTAIDNPEIAEAGFPGTIVLNNVPGIGGVPVNTSIQPVLLTQNDVDLCSSTRGISHKVFGHLNYSLDWDCWQPFIGVGGSAEFAQHHRNKNCQPNTVVATSNKKNCIDCALSEWSVWIKGGISFN